MDVLLKGKTMKLTPAQAIGKGGEADVFAIGNGKALKIFKGPDHPDFLGQPEQQKFATDRLAMHQQKLPRFPKGLPQRVVAPEGLATDWWGRTILGYEMTLVNSAEVLARFTDQGYRLQVTDAAIISKIFLDLRETVSGIHRKQVVIGDFNDLNILVKGAEAFVIDADSFQFQGFGCPVFTMKFLDPLISLESSGILIPGKPFSQETDWYAFNVMLMECLLFVNPFGGVYRPKDSQKRLPHALRPLDRITIFNPEVRYPKNALPIEVLPEALLQHFLRVFEKDERFPFPDHLLKDLHWTRCSNCGFEHARSLCPRCQAGVPVRVKEAIIIRGSVRARRIFTTSGRILRAQNISGGLAYVYVENGAIRREDGSILLKGSPEAGMRFDLLGRQTFVGYNNSLVQLAADGNRKQTLPVDVVDGIPQFMTNGSRLFRLAGGTLSREEEFGPETVGDVLPGQTWFWVGETFGFGFYRAAHLSVSFVFPVRSRGINDRINLPPIPGKLVGANCFFSQTFAWLFLLSQDQGRAIHQCVVIREDGEVVATLREEDFKTDWLRTLTGKCAVGNILLAATDSGLVRVEVVSQEIVETRRFPDTEPFLHDGCTLIPGRGGLYVVDAQEITLLQMES